MAVLNFNADIFFQSIVFVLKKKIHIEKTGKWEDVPETFSRVVRSSDTGGHSRIPIYHLHGCMLPQSWARRGGADTPAGMIFPENSYANLAGRMFSWAQSLFLYHAQADNLCSPYPGKAGKRRESAAHRPLTWLSRIGRTFVS
jgi:hypothetical protein